MTVILAAIYNEGEGAIIVADRQRMGTDSRLKEPIIVENEEITKIVPIRKDLYFAHSGSAEFWIPIFNDVNKRINPNMSYKKIRSVVEGCYRQHFMKFLETQLVYFGFVDLKDYYARGHTELPVIRINQIDKILREAKSPGDLLMVGKEDDKFIIYSLEDPGRLLPGVQGIQIIGSGAVECAKYVAETHRKKMNKEEVSKLLKKGKEMAEKDKGVGKLTQIVELPSKEDQ